jgi:hypothetical protein
MVIGGLRFMGCQLISFAVFSFVGKGAFFKYDTLRRNQIGKRNFLLPIWFFAQVW